MTTVNKDFMPPRGDYHKLIAYRKAECIYDITYHFAHTYLERGDRTIDQMVQAAETELKLYNVAKASLQELLADYEDFLRVRDMEIWPKDSPKAVQTRRTCRAHDDSAFYRERIKTRSAETTANIAIILIHQADVLMAGLIESAKRRFLEEGGIREEMTRARLKYRNGRK